MLTVRNLLKIYTNRFVIPVEKNVALREISLEAKKGEVTGIIGDSGSGKTTLLKCISGFLEVSAGEIYLDEIPVHELSSTKLTKYRNTNIGYISQRPAENLIEEFTVYENLEIPLIIQGIEPKKREKKINELLRSLGMLNLAHHKVKLLSGGEAQRISVLAAIIKSPRLLLADEPTGELDYANSVEIFQLIAKVTKTYNCITIVVSHDPLILRYSDKLYRLRNGVINSIIDKTISKESFEDREEELISHYFDYVPIDEFGRLCLPENIINELSLEDKAFVEKIQNVLVASSNTECLMEVLKQNKEKNN